MIEKLIAIIIIGYAINVFVGSLLWAASCSNRLPFLFVVLIIPYYCLFDLRLWKI